MVHALTAVIAGEQLPVIAAFCFQFPGTLMEGEMNRVVIRCPHCGHNRNVPCAKLPDKPARITCHKCEGVFAFDPEQFSATSEMPSTEATETVRTARAKLSTFARANILLGAMIFSLSFNPTGLLFQKLTGGMYGPVFRHHSPALYNAAIISICVVTSGLLIGFVVRKWLFLERLEATYKSTGWFILGNALILIYLPIRVFASTLQGGGPSLAVAVIGAVPVTVAKVCLGIGLLRVLIGIEPIRRA